MEVPKKVLYVSGSIGLGHVTRDLAVAGQLRKQCPGVELYWLASHPATIPLKEAGEKLLPEADEYANPNVHAEKVAKGYGMNVLKYASNERKTSWHNIKILKQIIRRERFDVVIGDEAYELAAAIAMKMIRIDVPFVMIYDFFDLNPMTKSPIEKFATYFGNQLWVHWDRKLFSVGKNLALFAGEPDDIPDARPGLFLPGRRDHAQKYYKFTGYILPFEPSDCTDKTRIREKLGYGKEPLIVCSIGGTAVGRELLELCGQAYPIIKRNVPELRMVLICGPRLSVDSVNVPAGIEIKGYARALYEHFAASDLVIVQGGGTATLELTALRRPFLYFPLANHCEQQIHVAERLARHQAGVKMVYSQTTPEILAEKVIAILGKNVDYPPISVQGAQKAARLISELL
jgi:UDP-N-acetylglucosamine:LPS N-acetylglucosamine transferase